MWVRRGLLLAPLLVGLLFLGAFLVARQHFDERLSSRAQRMELVQMMSGDASYLNPVLSTDTASGSINDLVFNGLMKYSENLELVGDLAERWDIEQTSICYLDISDDELTELARGLASALGEARVSELGIDRIEAHPPQALHLHLLTAGRAFEESVLPHLPEGKVISVRLVTVALKPATESDDEATIDSEEAVKRVLAAARQDPGLADRVIEHWLTSSVLFSIKVRGEEAPLVAIVNRLLTAQELGSVADVREFPFDNTPAVTFHIRPGVRFHDGHPLTAADVLFTYDTIMDESTKTVRRPAYEPVKRVEVVDESTVRVVYKEPFSPALESWGMGILPKHLLEGKHINTASFNRDPIGTGPYRFDEWQTDEYIRLAANDSYFEGRPHLDTITYRIVPEPPLREQEFHVGEADLYGPEPYQRKRFVGNEGYETYQRLSNSYTYIGYNLRNPLFEDVRVRRALTHAINRQQIVEHVLYGHGVIATGHFRPQMWYYPPDVKPLAYDPGLSRKLLAEAGWEDSDGDGILDRDGRPFRFTLITNNGNQLRADVQILVQEQLKRIGIDVELTLYEWSVFLSEKIDTRNFDACVLGWAGGIDPDCYEIWHSSQVEKGFNFVGYVNPEADRLLELGRTEFDQSKRQAIYREFHCILNEDQPYTFLYVPQGMTAVRRGEFMLAGRGEDRDKLSPITMTPAGVTYFLKDWVRVSQWRPEVTP